MFTNERVNLPADLAGTTEEFRELFYKVPNSDWTRIKGFPLPHILAYDLDELILNTPGMKSAEIDEAKVHLAGVLQQAYDCSIDRAYAIMHRIYIYFGLQNAISTASRNVLADSAYKRLLAATIRVVCVYTQYAIFMHINAWFYYIRQNRSEFKRKGAAIHT